MESSTDGVVTPLKTETNAGCEDMLASILKQGAQKMLHAAIEAEVAEYIELYKGVLDEEGHRLVVRNGHHPVREIQTGLGGIPVKKPKVNDKRVDADGNRFQFKSSIIPPYLKKTKAIEELIPWLYLRGISTRDFPQALEALLGEGAKGLSSNTVVRLKKCWEDEFEDWSKRDLSEEHFVYFWADGIYPRKRLDNSDRQGFLVIMGATKDGEKKLVAIGEGMRESEIAWAEVLRGLKKRVLPKPPELAIGDGALGFWAAISKEFPLAAQQRCWVHKTANILSKLPTSSQNKLQAF